MAPTRQRNGVRLPATAKEQLDVRLIASGLAPVGSTRDGQSAARATAVALDSNDIEHRPGSSIASKADVERRVGMRYTESVLSKPLISFSITDIIGPLTPA